jgi:hypothetical protein
MDWTANSPTDHPLLHLKSQTELPTPDCSLPEDKKEESHKEEPSWGNRQPVVQSRVNPFRNGRPPEGDIEHLYYVAGHGSTWQASGGLPAYGRSPRETVKKPGEIPDTWVAQSHFFPEAGCGFFFEIKGPYKRRGGSLLAVYYGQDSNKKMFSK